MIKNLNQYFNRALIKGFKGIPDVAEFRTTKIGIHEYAAVYGIERILREVSVIKLGNGPANRYLERQMMRITRYILVGKPDQALWLAERIFRRSIVFRILAMNRVCPDWFTWKPSKLHRVWRRLTKIVTTMSTKLRFKRVWIDKKPGDYARPIGAPSLEWRMMAYMQTDIWERLLKAQGAMQPWQHGGRSAKGVLTCWQELIPKIKSYEYIFEFDLKGFFDNVRHEYIASHVVGLLGERFSKQLLGILEMKDKPEKYTLPPEDADPALKAYKSAISSDPLLENWVREFTYEDAGYHLAGSSWQDLLGSDNELFAQNIERLVNLPASAWSDLVTEEEIQEWDEVEARIRGNLNLSQEYTKGMSSNPNTITPMVGHVRREVDEASEQDRAKGRDAWKGLSRPNRGMPQGLSWSPLISTVCVDIANKNVSPEGSLLMYMDDGLIFANTLPELERVKEQFKKNMELVGVELAPEKSGWIKATGEWMKEVPKFLGLSYLPKEDNLMSNTRGGTRMKFPATPDWDNLKAILERNPELTLSGVRSKFDKLINTKAYEAGLAHGFLGCMIAEACYRDAPSLDERKQDIEYGKLLAWRQIRESVGFIWKFQDLHPVLETLTNASSLAAWKFLQGPVIRELGMRTPRSWKRRKISLALERKATLTISTLAGQANLPTQLIPVMIRVETGAQQFMDRVIYVPADHKDFYVSLYGPESLQRASDWDKRYGSTKFTG